jgi:hypothetical protein
VSKKNSAHTLLSFSLKSNLSSLYHLHFVRTNGLLP